MTRNLINLSVLKDPSWWHWITTIPLLILYLSGFSWAVSVAVLWCVMVTAYFLSHTRRVKPYPVQIRIGYLVWMMVGLLPWMGWMHWIQLAGTSAMVTVGYCPLARLLNLLPFNRSRPLSWSFVGRTFFQEPCSGGLIVWSAKAANSATCCSIRSPIASEPCSLFNPSSVQEKQHAPTH